MRSSSCAFQPHPAAVGARHHAMAPESDSGDGDRGHVRRRVSRRARRPLAASPPPRRGCLPARLLGPSCARSPKRSIAAASAARRRVRVRHREDRRVFGVGRPFRRDVFPLAARPVDRGEVDHDRALARPARRQPARRRPANPPSIGKIDRDEQRGKEQHRPHGEKCCVLSVQSRGYTAAPCTKAAGPIGQSSPISCDSARDRRGRRHSHRRRASLRPTAAAARPPRRPRPPAHRARESSRDRSSAR